MAYPITERGHKRALENNRKLLDITALVYNGRIMKNWCLFYPNGPVF